MNAASIFCKGSGSASPPMGDIPGQHASEARTAMVGTGSSGDSSSGLSNLSTMLMSAIPRATFSQAANDKVSERCTGQV
eukprot:scaffold104403_cov31-Tisochrysis_lutea.AAC.4